MTFADLVRAVADDVGYPTSPAPDVLARLQRYVNEAQRAVLAEPGLAKLADSDNPLTVASVAGQARYVVASAVARIHHITERTNDLRLRPMSLAEYRALDPDATSSTGTPTHYVPIGIVGVAVQPSNASEVFVDSTSASDTNTAYVEGIITGGYPRTAAVTMTGTTAVSLDSLITTFLELNDFYLSHPAVGTVTLHEDASGGTELARIQPGQTRPSYYGFYLWPTPAAVVTYYVDYRRALVTLVNDTDEPPLPAEFHDLLADYARYREWEKKGDTDRAGIAKARYDGRLAQLKYRTQTGPDDVPIMGRRPLVGRSRLGAYFPADSWG